MVNSSSEYFLKHPYFDQEWRSWLHEWMYGRKSGNIVTIRDKNCEVAHLPFSLRKFESRMLLDFNKKFVKDYL